MEGFSDADSHTISQLPRTAALSAVPCSSPLHLLNTPFSPPCIRPPSLRPPPMPCFAQKRLSSSPPPLLGARPPPYKRIKMTHPSERPLSDPDVSPTPSGHPHRNASLALLSNADQTRLSPSPLTRCHAANEVCDSKPREYEHLVSAPSRSPLSTVAAAPSVRARFVACKRVFSTPPPSLARSGRPFEVKRCIVLCGYYGFHSQSFGLI